MGWFGGLVVLCLSVAVVRTSRPTVWNLPRKRASVWRRVGFSVEPQRAVASG